MQQFPNQMQQMLQQLAQQPNILQQLQQNPFANQFQQNQQQNGQNQQQPQQFGMNQQLQQQPLQRSSKTNVQQQQKPNQTKWSNNSSTTNARVNQNLATQYKQYTQLEQIQGGGTGAGQDIAEDDLSRFAVKQGNGEDKYVHHERHDRHDRRERNNRGRHHDHRDHRRRDHNRHERHDSRSRSRNYRDNYRSNRGKRGRGTPHKIDANGKYIKQKYGGHEWVKKNPNYDVKKFSQRDYHHSYRHFATPFGRNYAAYTKKMGSHENIQMDGKPPPTQKFEFPTKPEFDYEVEKLIAPWLSIRTSLILSPRLKLHNEIIEFCKMIEPKPQDIENRKKALAGITKLIEEKIDGAKVYPFGSYITNLYLPGADIDMVVICKGKSQQSILSIIGRLVMANMKKYKNVNIVKSAKVPVVKCTDAEYNVDLDISINKLNGIFQVSEVIKALKIYPEIKCLYLTLKFFLKIRNLNETYYGGIGSYLLFCMILTYLREVRKDYIKADKIIQLSKLSIGEHLLSFLEFYAIKFDWKTYKIIMTQGGSIEKKDEYSYNFSLVSPADATQDIGKSAFKVKELFGTFRNRFYFITHYNFQERESILKYLINPQNEEFLKYFDISQEAKQ